MQGERGIVIGTYHRLENVMGSAYFAVDEHGARTPIHLGGVTFSHHPHLVEPAIRRSILYFDHIEWPTTNADLPVAVPGLDVLVEQGLVHRTPLTLGAGVDPRSPSLFLFGQLEAANPGVWDFAHLVDPEPYGYGQKFDPTQADFVAKRGIEFELYNALPVPAPHVSFAEVLDFRDRRADELGAMRQRMQELYDQVIGSNDVPRAKIAALEQLEVAIRDVAASMNASKLDAVWRSIKIDLVLSAVEGAGAGVVVSELAHAPVQYAAAIGATLGAYRFIKKQVSSPINRPGPFAYIESASSEQIVKL